MTSWQTLILLTLHINFYTSKHSLCCRLLLTFSWCCRCLTVSFCSWGSCVSLSAGSSCSRAGGTCRRPAITGVVTITNINCSLDRKRSEVKTNNNSWYSWMLLVSKENPGLIIFMLSKHGYIHSVRSKKWLEKGIIWMRSPQTSHNSITATTPTNINTTFHHTKQFKACVIYVLISNWKV